MSAIRPASLLLTAVALLVISGALALPPTAQAQSETLVTNLSNSDDGFLVTELPSAQSFGTGDHSAGYKLDAVELRINKPTGSTRGLDVKLYTGSLSGNPAGVVFTFPTLAIPTGTSNPRFEAPAGTRLEPNTTYLIVFIQSGGSGGNLSAGTTNSLGQTGFDNWSIADKRHYHGGSWTSEQNQAYRMKVLGVAASTDATLSELVVNDGNANLTLMPEFASGTETYTEMVASTVAEVTVTPTLNDSNATIEYLDEDDATLTDAGTADGHQVTLAEGDNVIKVKVTASNGSTTKTYTVTVNRAAATDATLSDLVVNDGTTDLALTPTFVSGTETYTASVGTDVAEVTVTPMTTDTVATIEYLDGDDATLDDAGAADGHQVTLAEGDNVIKVKVTASNGSATKTYTVTVSRAAPTAPTITDVAETTEHFYLWTSTMTVGKTGTTTRGYEKDDYGSLSTGAKFNHPTFSPPPKHNFDPDYKFTVTAINSYTVDAVKTLVFQVDGVVSGDKSIQTGNITLWIENNGFPLDDGVGPPGSFQFTSSAGFDLDGPDLVWEVDDLVRVALTYERTTPSAPTNVRVTAPQGENGTLDVRWNPADAGTFPIECYMVEFRHTSGGTQRKVQHVAGSRGQGSGCGDNPSTRVVRTGLEPGVQYQVLVQALSGDGHGDWSEMRTVRTKGKRTLKARFMSPPEQHDGSGQVKVRVAFSEAIEESPENVGKHGVQVEGGKVTSVRQVYNQPAGDSVGRSSSGQNDEPEDSEQVWEFELEPDSDDDLTLRIDAGRSCDKPGAICTADGRSLSKGIVRTVQGPEPVPLTHFYLWTATMTVGESNGYFGYEPPNYGSFSTSADFNYPPFSPPPKHNFDPDYQHTMKNLYLVPEDSDGEKRLQFDSAALNDAYAVNLTLWIRNTGFPLQESNANSLTFSYRSGHDLTVPDLDWAEGDKVRLALTYERQPPSAPTNVRVTAPQGENGTLRVNWDEADAGTFPIEYYLVEFRNPSGETPRTVQSYVPSTETSVLRTDLERGVAYQVFVQALSGDGHGAESEKKTGVTTPGIPTSCEPNQGDLWCGVVRVGELPGAYGYNEFQRVGNLSDTDFNVGTNSYTITVLSVAKQGLPEGSGSGSLTFSIDPRPGAAEHAELLGMELHVNSDRFNLSDVVEGARGYYYWAASVANLDWSGEDYIIARLREASSSASSPAQVAEPLTAAFQGLPEAHDGETPFTFGIEFSETVSVTPETMSTHALTLEGGTVTGAARVDGETGIWEITVTPDTQEALSISLPPVSDCDADGAVCTPDRRSLSTWAAAIVTGPADQPEENTAATGTPTISGTVQVGATLTADTSDIADDDGLENVSFNHQWVADDTAIQNATNSTYTLADADEGKPIKVQVSFTDDGGNDETLTSAATEAVAGNEESMTSKDVTDWSATMTVEWVYQGYGYYSTDTKKAGSLSPASFNVDGTTYTVKMVETQGWWTYIGLDQELPFDFVLELDGTPFVSDDASFASYSYGNIYRWEGTGLSLMDGDTVEIRLLRAVEDETAVNSAATGTPIISGTPQVGETLTADTSGIVDEDGLDNVSFSHQWLADDTAIQGATNSTYTLADADEGNAIKVQVTFTDDADNEETLTSTTTVAVAAATQPNNPATGAPTVSGTVQVGETLTSDTSGIADDDGLDNVSYSYQWLADDTAIQGATNSTYTLVEADEGKYIKVQVSFTDNAGNDETLTSAATAVVSAATQPNSPATGSPTIRGTVQVGETLTADTSGIADEDRLDNASFSYQWLADDDTISGATNSTYTLVDADAGKSISVRVSFTDDADNEETLTSVTTDAVTAAPEPPAQPTGLSSTVSHDTVTLNWEDPNDNSITGYVILRRDKEIHEEGTFVTVEDDTESEDNTYTDDTVEPSKQYVYRIKAINAHGLSEISSWVRAYTPATPEPASEPPAKPTGLSATATHDQAVLTWDNPGDDGITGYVILRRNQETDAEGEFTELVSNTGSADTTYSDESVVAETRYTYRIKAINEHGVSERSRWFHIDTPAAPVPAEPTGLSGTATHDQVTLIWDDPNDNSIDGYVILRRNRDTDAKGEFTELVADTGSTDTTYSDDTVAAETRYTYRIKAINEHGVSERSRWFHLNTPAAPVPEG